MMAELLKYASQIGIHTICGNLSLVDSDHKGRLHAFYKKHGFEIIQYDTPDDLFYGEVIKNYRNPMVIFPIMFISGNAYYPYPET